MFRSLSVTRRLTLFFTLVAAAIVFVLALLIMVAVERHFLELDRLTLLDKRHLTEDILASASSEDDARKRLSEALNNHHGLYVLVSDPAGREPLYVSEEFRPPESVLASLGTAAQGEIHHWQQAGREFHALSAQASASYKDSARLRVVVAIDTAHHTQFTTELQRTIALYAVLATAVSGLFGWFAAHQGLAPLRAMKTKAAGVTAQQLNQRMPVESVPMEMADLARALNQMLDRLQEDFRRLSDFSSDLAHELRTPISNLLTQTQVALSQRRDADTCREILASNAEEFQRLGRMVSDMLFLAKTERGVDLPRKERFSAAPEVRALMEFYDAVAEEKSVRLILHGDGDIVGDRLMFRRAVSNLLSNALRHTAERSEVSIRIDGAPDATRVTVENAGEEIDPKLLPRLFDRFFRADPSRAHPESEGAGLGLPITRAIVEAHGGTVAASSSQGRTRFALEFPR